MRISYVEVGVRSELFESNLQEIFVDSFVPDSPSFLESVGFFVELVNFIWVVRIGKSWWLTKVDFGVDEIVEVC